MHHLWSPWRLAYVTRAARPGDKADDGGCIFCNPRGPNADLVLIRGRLCYVILNLYPYNNGHLMVVTNRHVPSFAETTPEERTELMEWTRIAEMALNQGYQPHGINAGVNLGRPAGAGVLDHLHIHLVPRWNGDTSFMGVIGDTRVLPEDLPHTAARMRPIFERLAHDEKRLA
jgi:ATP adenylyltransferase